MGLEARDLLKPQQFFPFTSATDEYTGVRRRAGLPRHPRPEAFWGRLAAALRQLQVDLPLQAALLALHVLI